MTINWQREKNLNIKKRDIGKSFLKHSIKNDKEKRRKQHTLMIIYIHVK